MRSPVGRLCTAFSGEVTDMDAQIVTEVLGRYCYFSGLSEDALRELASRAEPLTLPAGTEIIREGTPGDAFYVLVEGEAEVSKEGRHGQRALLSVLRGREFFGETALLTDALRSATVRATTEVRVLRLPKADFERIVLSDACIAHLMEDRVERFARFDRVRGLEPFARLDPRQLAGLAERLRETTFGAEQDIVTQGDKGDRYYIIKSGSVCVIKRPPEGRPAPVAVLGEGEGFGEEALLTRSSRSATVRTLEETVVWALDKEDFTAILGASYLKECGPDEVPARADGSGGFVLLDVRTPTEYAEEYIPGTINVPLDRLRSAYAELDPAKTYYAFCLSGARSAVAAFLLGMHGIEAFNVRGGLLGWKGPLVTSGQGGIHQPHKHG